MKHVQKSVLLWYSPEEMYDLVTRVTAYPEFLPWCQGVEVLATHDDGLTARLHLSYAGVKQAFTTRNTHVPGRELKMSLVDGPFSVLDGTWRFIPLSSTTQGGAQEKACKIEFDMAYEFSNRAFGLLLSPVFDRVANTLVDAFVKRAEQVHGPR
jgi:ribosome-associated toxin RatA of RatAB toxin-antitoxin module